MVSAGQPPPPWTSSGSTRMTSPCLERDGPAPQAGAAFNLGAAASSRARAKPARKRSTYSRDQPRALLARSSARPCGRACRSPIARRRTPWRSSRPVRRRPGRWSRTGWGLSHPSPADGGPLDVGLMWSRWRAGGDLAHGSPGSASTVVFPARAGRRLARGRDDAAAVSTTPRRWTTWRRSCA